MTVKDWAILAVAVAGVPHGPLIPAIVNYLHSKTGTK